MKRPRVLQFITHLALGGAERVAFNLMRETSDRFDFGLYAANGVDDGPVGQGMKRELEEMNVPLFVGTSVPIKFGGMVLSGWWGGKAVKQFQPDLIHLHTEIPEAAYASMVSMRPWLGKISVVRTIHNSIYWNPWRKLGIWCDRKMERSYVACVAQGAKDAVEGLRRESGAGPFAQPPEIVFNGVLVNGNPRPLGKLPGDRVRILFAGRFEDQKGADLLPQIIRSVKSSKPVDLVIHGTGKHEPTLRELSRNAPAGWTIQVNGPVPNLSQQMPEFDLLIMPSRYEGLALLAIEAALMGVPVIATDGPGMREGFPSDYPWLAKACDPASFAQMLQNALNDPGSWQRAVEAARDHAHRYFDMKVMCDAYERMYARALG